MDRNSAAAYSETSSLTNSKFVAEYRYVITFAPPSDGEPIPKNYELKVMNEIENVLSHDFAAEVEFMFGGTVQVRLGPIEHGSIMGSVLLVLGATVTAMDFLSKYKDLHESLDLLRTQLRTVLSRQLNRMYPLSVSRTINTTLLQGPVARAAATVAPAPADQSVPQQTLVPVFYSTSFFIYLLVMNIILFFIIAVLVYPAMMAMYFNRP